MTRPITSSVQMMTPVSSQSGHKWGKPRIWADLNNYWLLNYFTILLARVKIRALAKTGTELAILNGSCSIENLRKVSFDYSGRHVIICDSENLSTFHATFEQVSLICVTKNTDDANSKILVTDFQNPRRSPFTMVHNPNIFPSMARNSRNWRRSSASDGEHFYRARTALQHQLWPLHPFPSFRGPNPIAVGALRDWECKRLSYNK